MTAFDPTHHAQEGPQAHGLPEGSASSVALVPTSFSTLLYRYFFYGWLFRDVGRSTRWARAAAWRHNREQARWLPTYIRRWLVMGGALFALAWLVECLLMCPRLSAFFYVPSALSIPFSAVTTLCWTCLVRDRPL